jgi:HSP20 family protein
MQVPLNRTKEEEMNNMPEVRRIRTPWTEMNRLQREMETLFGGGTQDLWAPAVDVEETPDYLVFQAELPGMSREDIDVELEDGVLTLRGEKQDQQKGDNVHGLLYERRWGTFTRRFTLPRAVDPNGINATYSNGILTVRVPKAEEAKGRKIEVMDGGRDVS